MQRDLGRSRFLRLSLALAASMVVASCTESEPGGQVIAVVNGDEITVPELNAEARARGLVIGSDRGVRDALIRDLVERKLLVHEALARKLDRTPEHLLARRRMDEIMLTQALTSTLGRNDGGPTPAELAAVVKSRPQAFDQRALVSVDRIAVPANIEPGLIRELEGARTLEQAQALLAAKRVGAERRREVWDSASLSAEMFDEIGSSGEGQVVVLKSPDQIMITRVVSVIPQPTPPAARAQVAREMLRSEKAQAEYRRLLDGARSSAKIRYQRQFAPGP